MSTLFLDMDGVLNCQEFAVSVKAERGDVWRRCNGDLNKYNPAVDLDAALIERLNQIVEKTNCEIVISSSWRTPYGDRMPAILASKGFKYPEKIVGQTLVLGIPRGNEIKAYVETNNVQGNIAILDDDDDMVEMSPFLIQTRWWGPREEAGLTEDAMHKTIEMLSK